MGTSLKKQTKAEGKNTSSHATLNTKNYLSSVKECQPEIIKGYTYAF